MSRRPHVPESPRPHVPTSPSPHVPMSPSPRVPESLSPRVPTSPRPRVPTSPHPRVPTSQVPRPRPTFSHSLYWLLLRLLSLMENKSFLIKEPVSVLFSHGQSGRQSLVWKVSSQKHYIRWRDVFKGCSQKWSSTGKVSAQTARL